LVRLLTTNSVGEVNASNCTELMDELTRERMLASNAVALLEVEFA